MQVKNIKIVLLITSIFILNNAQAGLPKALSEKYPSVQIKENQIKLRVPHVAEEGSVVPVKIGAVNLPDNEVHITEISFFSENNMNCPISKYSLTPTMLGEGLATRIKLPRTTTVHAIAKLSNGDVISGSQEVKVTIGGCGGGGALPTGASAGNYCLKKSTISQ